MRETERSPRDVTDGEWAILRRLVPSARTGGHPRTSCVSNIRRRVLREGHGIRSVAGQAGLSRNKVGKYLQDDDPTSDRCQVQPVRHKLRDGYVARFQELFEQDLKRPHLERHQSGTGLGIDNVCEGRAIVVIEKR